MLRSSNKIQEVPLDLEINKSTNTACFFTLDELYHGRKSKMLQCATLKGFAQIAVLYVHSIFDVVFQSEILYICTGQ